MTSKLINLKIINPYFSEMWSGEKSFIFRQDDGKNFEVGDVLMLSEHDPEKDINSGRTIMARVERINRLDNLLNLYGISDKRLSSFVIMATTRLARLENAKQRD